MGFLTHQQIFDKVVNHLYSQGVPALSHDDSCRYRYVDKSGRVLKCAVGCLIRDEVYVSGIEGFPMSNFTTSPSDKNFARSHMLASMLHSSGVATGIATRKLLARLQEAHDSSAVFFDNEPPRFEWDALHLRLKAVAHQHGLSVDGLTICHRTMREQQS